MTAVRLLLDEHVGRLFERMLRERGYHVEQAKDRFGERTSDVELLTWCSENDAVLLTNNAKDFERLHREHDHAGLLLFRDQGLPDVDPEGMARTIDEAFNQYGPEGIEKPARRRRRVVRMAPRVSRTPTFGTGLSIGRSNATPPTAGPSRSGP